jgi:hypothetical protein
VADPIVSPTADLGVTVGLILDQDRFPPAKAVREAGITLGVGKGPYRDYGRQIATTFYKQRITIGR